MAFKALIGSLWLGCFQIANEPPPLREIPPDCGPLTAEVLRAGLQKDPGKRASASVLKEKTIKALKEGNYPRMKASPPGKVADVARIVCVFD